jgi:glycosyltransferase involved in cell wall biosynthesis
MKIVFVLPYAGMAGGIRVVATYADRLMKCGHEVHVVSQPLRRFTPYQKVVSLVAGRGWPRSWRPEPSYFDRLAVPHRVLETRRDVTAADVPDADAVVAVHWSVARAVQALPPSKGAKVIFMQGYEALPGEEVSELDASWRMAFHKIAVSKWLVELGRDKFGDTRMSYVPNSVDRGQFFASERGRQAQPTVGVIYSTSPFKACDVSLRAYGLAARQVRGLRLMTFGADEPSQHLPLPEGATFAYRPPQDAIRDMYSRCDVWLFGSRQEGFGLPILEAMACRTPVIGTPAGAAPELIGGGGGLLVKSEDSADMARAIGEMFQMSEARWRSMSQAALRTAESYNWDDATALFEAALRQAIDRTVAGELGPWEKPGA